MALVLDASSLRSLELFFEDELRRLCQSGVVLPSAALQSILVSLYGIAAPAAARLRFLTFAAPLARRIALEGAHDEACIEAVKMTVADFKRWWVEVETLDPTTPRIIDLHCFAGMDLAETAAALHLSVTALKEKLLAARQLAG